MSNEHHMPQTGETLTGQPQGTQPEVERTSEYDTAPSPEEQDPSSDIDQIEGELPYRSPLRGLPQSISQAELLAECEKRGTGGY